MEEEQLKDETEIEAEPQEVQDRARSMGWIPKEDFKGDETKWRPASEYIERAETLMPILKSQLGRYENKLGRYESEITGLKASLDAQRKTAERLAKMSEKVGEEAYVRAKRDLTKQQAQAVADGDVEKWQQLEDQKDKLERPEPIKIEEPEQKTQPAEDPVFSQWHQNNDWYDKDEDMTDFAKLQADKLMKQNPNTTLGILLDQVEAKVKMVFPHKFANLNRGNVDMVDTGQVQANRESTGKKTYNNLPGEAKAQCDSLVGQGLLTREKYVADYFGLEDEQKERFKQMGGM